MKDVSHKGRSHFLSDDTSFVIWKLMTDWKFRMLRMVEKISWTLVVATISFLNKPAHPNPAQPFRFCIVTSNGMFLTNYCADFLGSGTAAWALLIAILAEIDVSQHHEFQNPTRKMHRLRLAVIAISYSLRIMRIYPILHPQRSLMCRSKIVRVSSMEKNYIYD